MKKCVCVIFVMILSGYSAFAGAASVTKPQEMNKVLNVFYDGLSGELAINIYDGSLSDTDFMRTSEVVLLSQKMEFCTKGCLATLKKETPFSFGVHVGDRKVASVVLNDPDGLLDHKSFELLFSNRKKIILMNLDVLAQDSKSNVTIQAKGVRGSGTYIRVINAFFEGVQGRLSVNTNLEPLGRPGFLKTQEVYLISSEIKACVNGCMVQLQTMDNRSFSLMNNNEKLADVYSRHPTNLLMSSAFGALSLGGKVILVLNLDLLKRHSYTQVIVSHLCRSVFKSLRSI